MSDSYFISYVLRLGEHLVLAGHEDTGGGVAGGWRSDLKHQTVRTVHNK